MIDNLLFESRGMNKNFMQKMKIILIISFCIGILMFILINIEVEKTRYFMAIESLSDPLPKYKVHLISNQRDRIMFLYIGIILIANSIIGLFMIPKWNKTYLKIYDNYIEGMNFISGFKYFYDEIKHIEKQNSKLIINTNTRDIGISINGDIDNAYTIIQNKIRN